MRFTDAELNYLTSHRPARPATAIADDGNGRELARQDISLTDFPLDEVSLYLTDNTLLLPSEY